METPENIQAEELIINLLLSDKENVKTWQQSGLDISRFDPQHNHLLSGIIYAANNDVSLTKATYKAFLADYKKISLAESAAQMSVYDRCLMKMANKDDLPMLVGKVKEYYVNRKTTENLNTYRKERDKLGVLGANRSLIQKLQALDADTTETKAEFVEVHEYKETFMKNLMERRKNPNTRLTCGIDEIDGTMDRGFAKGHLSLFCAPVSCFKTTVMVNIAANIFAKSGENILYVPLEMDHEEIITKLVSRETKISMHKIEHAELLTEDEIKRLDAEYEKWASVSHRFAVLDMAERTKVSVLKREIEKRISYFKPRVVFVDYVDNLVPDYNRSRSDLDMNDILEDMRKMGKALGFHLVSAAQISSNFLKQFKEEKEGKQSIADQSSIRGGVVYSANSDNVYFQVPDPAMPNERLIFMCGKSRHGKKTFGANNSPKAHLIVRPDIALIESPQDVVWTGPKDNGLLELASVMPTQADIEEGSPF